MSRIYLDNAATSWPKPESVYRAVDETQRSVGVSSGRGSHASSVSANQILTRGRQRIASLIGANTEAIAFANSGTDALSTAIFGTLKQDDHAITTTADHNSVIRPLVHLRDSGIITLSIVESNDTGFVSATSIESAMNSRTKLVALSHASNVLGTVQPVGEIGNLCQQQGVLFLLDAAQTIGHLPININETSCNMLAAPGHKGLLGPLGTGFLYVGRSATAGLIPLRFGGTGSQSVDEHQPTTMPQMLEAGSLNVPTIAGLVAGIEFLNSDQGRQRTETCEALALHLWQSLQSMEGVDVFGSDSLPSQHNLPVVAFSIAGYDSETVASILDSSFNIQTRAGFHCAPLLHTTIGSADTGLVRLSPGLFNTRTEIDATIAAVAEIVQS